MHKLDMNTYIELLLNSCEKEQKLGKLNISCNNLTNIDQDLKSRTYKVDFVQIVLSTFVCEYAYYVSHTHFLSQPNAT